VSNVLDRPPCDVCGETLVEAITPHEVVAVGGRRVRFERHTDYVMCPHCMTMYRITDLRAGHVVPVTDTELMQQREATESEENDEGRP
jgi:hypothetical protein